MTKIDRFTGEYAFLSNFYKATFLYRGLEFPTAEHAFVFEKDGNQKRFILQCQGLLLRQFDFEEYFWLSAKEAKILGRQIVLRDNWDTIKRDIMYHILIDKFDVPALRKALLKTGDAYLEEGNTWNDTYWGICNRQGENHLGKTLMMVRNYYDAPPF